MILLILYHEVSIHEVLTESTDLNMTPTEYLDFGDPVSISSGSMAALQATVMGLGPGCLEPRNLMPFPVHPSFAPPFKEYTGLYSVPDLYRHLKISFALYCSSSSNTPLFSFPLLHSLIGFIRSTVLTFSHTQHGFYRSVKSTLHSKQPEDHFLHRF